MYSIITILHPCDFPAVKPACSTFFPCNRTGPRRVPAGKAHHSHPDHRLPAVLCSGDTHQAGGSGDWLRGRRPVLHSGAPGAGSAAWGHPHQAHPSWPAGELAGQPLSVLSGVGLSYIHNSISDGSVWADQGRRVGGGGGGGQKEKLGEKKSRKWQMLLWGNEQTEDGQSEGHVCVIKAQCFVGNRQKQGQFELAGLPVADA